MNVNLIVAVAPTIAIILFVTSFDKYEKEPSKLLLSLFVYGCLSVIPALVLEQLLSFSYSPSDTASLLLDVFFIALVEEFVKFVPARLKAYRHPAFNEIYDGILYCVFIALGFATIENIMYVVTTGMATGLLRAVTAVPAHAMFGVSMGYNLSQAKARHSLMYGIRAFASPVFLHWVYDLILFSNKEYALAAFLPYLAWMYFASIRRIRSSSKIQPFDQDFDGNGTPPDF
jgi:RsiW-degrading membrane proteinase PrsW (M82 family)